MNAQLLERTVGELVAEKPYRSRVFEKVGIDYCCKGNMALNQACAQAGVAPDAILEAIAQLDTAHAGEVRNEPWRDSVEAMVTHIVDTHHAYLKENLPRLAFLTEKVARVHGGDDARLIQLAEAFLQFKAETDEHLAKEEMMLFPFCRMLGRGERPPFPPTVGMPIRKMMSEHEDHGRNLDLFRNLTDGYVPPSHACNTYRAMLDGLQEMEQDLHTHIHLENSVLFPWAMKLEEELGGVPAGAEKLSCH
ncbi:MAG TPA: iron-sulfur cluster repair di-iron protein [Holophagaceae bacterium]|nr:iron-sulfur cluster repair di-iron protein [Holophagaceae bacterium]